MKTSLKKEFSSKLKLRDFESEAMNQLRKDTDLKVTSLSQIEETGREAG